MLSHNLIAKLRDDSSTMFQSHCDTFSIFSLNFWILSENLVHQSLFLLIRFFEASEQSSIKSWPQYIKSENENFINLELKCSF